MKGFAPIFSILLCLFVTFPALATEKPLVIDVWPGKPAYDDAVKIGVNVILYALLQ